MPTQFTWIPFYEEAAQKLVAWENRQTELIAFLSSLNDKGLPVTKVRDKDASKQSQLLDEIDPFTFFGTLNRQTTVENRILIAQELKVLLGVQSDSPKDFDGIPLLDNRSSWFISYKQFREAGDVPTLWNVLRTALGPDPLTDPQFATAFNAAQEIRGVTSTNLTMGLYWIRPSVFLSLDKRNCDFLEIQRPKPLTAAAYAEILSRFKGKSFPELSFTAWKSTLETWKVATSSTPAYQPGGTDVIAPALERFLIEFPKLRSSGPLTRDPALWSTMEELQRNLSNLPAVRRNSHIKIDWSVGAGNWARVPWIALMDERVTTSTQRGVYCVFLFPEDMSGVYLTLNQGVTDVIRQMGRTSGRVELQTRAEAIRATAPQLSEAGFLLDNSIDLKTDGDLGTDYERSTVAHKFYPAGNIPSDGVIAADVEALLELYGQVVARAVTEHHVAGTSSTSTVARVWLWSR